MRHAAFPAGVTREQLIDWYRAGRARTKWVFDLLTPEAYYERPIALRNPIVFYEGHLPAFTINTLVKLAHRSPGIDAQFETLFARGIDPDSPDAVKDPTDVWPSREDVQAYADAADACVLELLANAPLEDDRIPELRGGEAVFTILEHEQMHHETLLYMLHNLPYEKKRQLAVGGWRLAGVDAPAVAEKMIAIPRGRATLGRTSGFGWDNEFPSHVVDVDAFSIGRFNVTNGDWLAFMDATAAAAPNFWTRRGDAWMWRGMFGDEPLALTAPVWVTHNQASAYASWRGMRLPSEGEFHRAAYGSPTGEERLHPWGDAPAEASRGNFDFAALGPVPSGLHPAGASAWGVEDLVGNGWEWT
ncbi:MAG: gamma-glutamyl hercynylcysteine S-oxide synthase, partial [Acidobacteriota bacterium]|nr:gamma-glutamyl hercynylcysteine S-oxide synthase [Acidobacteriota bacterium]